MFAIHVIYIQGLQKTNYFSFFSPRIFSILLPCQHWAAIGCTKNCQPIGVTVHSHYFDNFESLMQQIVMNVTQKGSIKRDQREKYWNFSFKERVHKSSSRVVEIFLNERNPKWSYLTQLEKEKGATMGTIFSRGWSHLCLLAISQARTHLFKFLSSPWPCLMNICQLSLYVIKVLIGYKFEWLRLTIWQLEVKIMTQTQCLQVFNWESLWYWACLWWFASHDSP